jgi:excisionase family DNA binding protein
LKQEDGRIPTSKPEVARISGDRSHTTDNVIPEKGLTKPESRHISSRDSKPGPQGGGSRRILVPDQAAELFGCDDKTITRWARNGYLPAHPIGEGKKRYWRFFEDELIDWLQAQSNGSRAA